MFLCAALKLTAFYSDSASFQSDVALFPRPITLQYTRACLCLQSWVTRWKRGCDFTTVFVHYGYGFLKPLIAFVCLHSIPSEIRSLPPAHFPKKPISVHQHSEPIEVSFIQKTNSYMVSFFIWISIFLWLCFQHFLHKLSNEKTKCLKQRSTNTVCNKSLVHCFLNLHRLKRFWEFSAETRRILQIRVENN